MSELIDPGDGENRAVRAFLMHYGTPGLTVKQQRDNMRRAGWDGCWPSWVPEVDGHLTKGGAQAWLRYLFSLEAAIEAELSQSPAPVAPTFDEWWENHGKYNALFKFDHNASPSDRLARAKELMSLSWEVARESPAPVAVQPSQWQDIATAPKDGAAVRLWFPTVPYPCAWDGWWSATARRWVPHEPGRDVIVSDLPEPTHWQPLTSPLSSSPEDKPK